MKFSAAYDFTIERYLALIRARQERNGASTLKRYALIALLYVVALLAMLLWQGTLSGAGSWSVRGWGVLSGAVIGGILVLFMLIALIDGFFLRVVHPLVFRRYSQANKHIDIDIGDDGVRWRGSSVEGAVGWPAIKEITHLKDGSGTVLWIGKIEGILLPAAAFASRGAYNAALQFLESKIGVTK